MNDKVTGDYPFTFQGLDKEGKRISITETNVDGARVTLNAETNKMGLNLTGPNGTSFDIKVDSDSNIDDKYVTVPRWLLELCKGSYIDCRFTYGSGPHTIEARYDVVD